MAKLRDRLEGAIENKKSLAQDTANHSPTGQKLIESLNRTLRCKWQGSSIGRDENSLRDMLFQRVILIGRNKQTLKF